MKRFISLFMVIIIIVSCVTVMAVGLESSGFVYLVENNEITITGYNNSDASIVIPDTIAGKPVTKIGNYAFASRKEWRQVDISALTLPASLRVIGDGAFTVNSTVSELSIPAGVESIGSRAFHCWIALQTLQFEGNSLKYIGKNAFRNCHALTGISFPGSLEMIDEGAFSYCTKLNSVTIPSSVSMVEREAFLACTSLGQVTFKNANTGIGDNAFDLTLTDSSDATKRALKVYGYEDSSAQRFAAAEGFTFTELSTPVISEDTIYPAGPGPYYVKVQFTVSDTNNFEKPYRGYKNEQNDSAGISLLCRSVNGTDNINREIQWDIASQMKKEGNYELSANLEGFPYMLYGYLDDNFAFGTTAFSIKRLYVGNGHDPYQLVWSGSINLASKIQPYGVSLDWDNKEKRDYFNKANDNYVASTSGAWEKPYAKTMQTQFDNTLLSLNKQDDETHNDFTYTAYDQYGVQMDASLCTAISASSSANTVSSNMFRVMYEDGSGTVVCNKDAHLPQAGQNTQDISLQFTWEGKDATNSFTSKFTLEDEKYNISWLSDMGNLICTQNVFYGETPNKSVAQKAPDADYHYTDGRWYEEPVPAVQDATYQAVYDAHEHTFETDEQRSVAATCESEGTDVLVCAVCGYEKVQTTPVLTHDFDIHITEPTCTQQGFTTYACRACAYTYQADFTPALGHEFVLEELSDAALRTPATVEQNPTYYYTCRVCGDVSRQEDTYFEHVCASLSGTVDMSSQYRSISVVLYHQEIEVARVELEPMSDGEFTFCGLEPDGYSLVLEGAITTVASIENIDLTTGEKMNLCESENEEVRSIAVYNGDVNRDGLIDIADISLMLSSDVYSSKNAAYDLNNNRIVALDDIEIMLLASNYGAASKHFNM